MTRPEGTIYLITRAPVSPTYDHTIDFKTAEDQNAFWRSLSKMSLYEYSYIRRERRTIKVNKTFESLEGVNYLMYQNRADGKWFYCFVTGIEYVSDTVSAIYFDIDVMQTYLFDFEIKPSYVAQAHVDRWTPDLKPIYSRTDEGLEYGTEYVTEAAFEVKRNTAQEWKAKHGWYLIYCKEHTMALEGISAEPTKVYNNAIPYCVYLIPHIEVGGEFNDGTSYYAPVGCNVEFEGSMTHDYESFRCASLTDFMRMMSRTAFGEYVQQIVYVPYLPIQYNFIVEDLIGLVGIRIFNEESGIGLDHATIGTTTDYCNLIKISSINTDEQTPVTCSMDIFEGLEDVFPTAEEWEAVKKNPYTTEYDRRFQSKLLCYPYRYNIFTDWRNAPALIKNEYIGGDKITMRQVFGWGFNNPQRYYIEDYRQDPVGRECSITQMLPMEQPIITDAYYSYMLQNKNQISANIANMQASAGIANAQAIAGGLAGAVAGIASGKAAAGLTGLVNTGFTIAQNQQNIANAIRGENAKQSDIKNLPDTINNPNDCSFNILDESHRITFYRKAICCDFEEQLAQYWHMFGYVVKKVMVPNLKSRARYNYVKTVGANIVGDMEQNYIAAIKAIFDRGITFWHYTEKNFAPLDYTFENIEVSLL